MGLKYNEFLNVFVKSSRFGVNVFKIQNFSIGTHLTQALDSIEKEKNKRIIGKKKRIVEDFVYDDMKRDILLSTIIEIPITLKQLMLENDKFQVKNHVEYYPRYIRAIIRLTNQLVYIFAQSQTEVKFFIEYLKAITMDNIDPIPIIISSDNLKQILREFNTITQLKLILNEKKGLNFIRFSGRDLVSTTIVKEILNKDESSITDLGGIFALPNGTKSKIRINNKARIRFNVPSGQNVLEEIVNFFMNREKMFLN